MNSPQLLVLPSVTRAQMQTQNRLASGYLYPFTLGEESGELRLLANGLHNIEADSHWRCALGGFSLCHAEPLINLLSHCPIPPLGVFDENDSWQWALFNQYLSPDLARLLGELAPAEEPPLTETAARLHVTLGERHAECQIYLSHQQLAHWLSQPGWQCLYTPLPAAMAIAQPLLLGRITLLPTQLALLTIGDLLVPSLSYFTPEGQGYLHLADRRLHGQITLPCHFLIHHLESTPLSTPTENVQTTGQWHDLPNSADSPQLASLPLALEVRCGRIVLTLGELGQLQAGNVVTVDNIIPGQAGLYHGDTLLARGELVDVEGHLGLQITQLLLASLQEGK